MKVRINESTLRNLVRESVIELMEEGYFRDGFAQMGQGIKQGAQGVLGGMKTIGQGMYNSAKDFMLKGANEIDTFLKHNGWTLAGKQQEFPDGAIEFYATLGPMNSVPYKTLLMNFNQSFQLDGKDYNATPGKVLKPKDQCYSIRLTPVDDQSEL